MAINNGGGGYQIGDGNLNEVQLGVQNTPVSITGDMTLTGSQITNNLFVVDTSADATMTLPTVSILETAIPNAKKVNSAFSFSICNAGPSYQVTVASSTGWTIVGNPVVLENTSATFRARKTGIGSWTLYRTAG